MSRRNTYPNIFVRHLMRRNTTNRRGNDIIKDELEKYNNQSPSRNMNVIKKRRYTRMSYKDVNNNTSERFDNKVKILFRGYTTENENHNHLFELLSNYTVRIYEAVHPMEHNIRHHHIYQGKYPAGSVTYNASDCYPNCKSMYGVEGAVSHNHELIFDEKTEELMNKGNEYIQKFNSIINNRLDSILNIKHVVGRQIKIHGFRYVKYANQYKIECNQRQCKKLLSARNNQISSFIELLKSNGINPLIKDDLFYMVGMIDKDQHKRIESSLSFFTSLKVNDLLSMVIDLPNNEQVNRESVVLFLSLVFILEYLSA